MRTLLTIVSFALLFIFVGTQITEPEVKTVPADTVPDTIYVQHEVPQSVDEDEVLWLARTLYVEAPPPSRGHTSYEMELIAATVLERRDDRSCPSTIWGVVNQDWQFSGVHRAERGVMQLTLEDYDNESLSRGTLNMWRRAVREARAALQAPKELRPTTANSYANISVSGKKPWMKPEHLRFQTGAHTFYDVPVPCGGGSPRAVTAR